MSLTPLYIGIDISKAHLDVFTHETGDFTRYRNTTAGIGELLAVLDNSVALIVLEPTAGHEKPVMRALQQARLPVACVHAAALMADMPALGTIDNCKAKALGGLAPMNRDSGQRKGRRYIAGGRPNVRQCMYQVILSASQYNPDIKAHYEKKLLQEKILKDAMMACAAKLLCTLNALLREDRKWQP